MPSVNFGPADELPPGASRQVEHGDQTLVLCNHDGAIRALDGLCPHRNGPLGHGAFSNGRLVCPWHAWEFDCVSGEYDYDPSIRLAVYPVRIEDNQIVVELPEAPCPNSPK
jgi:nitrite reductase/ring-hydroxylating ferredoxin subunit